MNYIVIEGLKPWDGRYEFDLEGSELTTREWGWIKRHSGYLPLTIEQGFDGADPELFACFAAIALRRAGKVEPRELGDVFERIADSPFGATIRMESDTDKEEENEGPPPASSTRNGGSSGPGSPTSSEISELHPLASGTPASATSESPQTTTSSAT